MLSVGLVLGAGGPIGDPWHCGVLSRLAQATGWEPRDADLIVATSAGAFTAVGLRCQVSAADRVAQFRGKPMSEEAEEVFARISTKDEEIEGNRDWRPLSPAMSLRALVPPWRIDPLRLTCGFLPRGTRSGLTSQARMDELHPGRWPSQPTWIVAVRASDGKRVVFGRDDVSGTIGEAVRASSAVPGVYMPTKIDGVEYVDGGVHSSTNADLVATLGFDLVIISSPMTDVFGSRKRCDSPLRKYFTKRLNSELLALNRSGTAVVVVSPHPASKSRLGRNNPNRQRDAVLAGEFAVDRLLETLGGLGLKTLFERTKSKQQFDEEAG